MSRWDRRLYPKDWNDIAAAHKQAAGSRCQRCNLRAGDWTYNRFGRPCRVVLTTAHPDHDPHNPGARLAVWCLSCHLRYDASREQRRRKYTNMQIARGQLVLWEEERRMPP